MQSDSSLRARCFEVGIPYFFPYLPEGFIRFRKFFTWIVAMFGSTYLCEQLFRMEVASSRPDHLSTLSATKTSKLSLLVKHHILAMDEAS